MWIRYWLASGGINPDRDVTLITIPPAQMVANMKVDKMDGFCVGSREQPAIEDGIGFTAVTTQQLWKDPQKRSVRSPRSSPPGIQNGKGRLKALHLASVTSTRWRTARSSPRSSPAGIYQLPALHRPRAPPGQVRVRRRAREQDPNYMIFSNRTQLPAPDLRQVVADAVQALGHGEDGTRLQRHPEARAASDSTSRHEGAGRGHQVAEAEITLFDGVFDGSNPRSTRPRSRCTAWRPLHEATRVPVLPLVGVGLALLAWWAPVSR